MQSTRLPITVRRTLGLIVAVILMLTMHVFVDADRAEAAPGPSFTNPVVDVPNSADPTLVYHEGFYYYVATTWSSGHAQVGDHRRIADRL